MKKAVQSWFSEVGENACFALSIIEGGRPGCSDETAVYFLNEGQRLGYLDAEFLVYHHVEFMALVAGGTWEYEKCPADYEPKNAEVCVEEWLWKYQHFMLRRDGVLIDTLGESQTRLRGKCVFKRIFRRLV
jgi:hypothetical protein